MRVKTFTRKEICDASKYTEAIVSLTAESRQKVDEIVNKALKAGATRYRDPVDQGWMHERSFQDLDGHLWMMIYMDVSKIKAPEKSKPIAKTKK